MKRNNHPETHENIWCILFIPKKSHFTCKNCIKVYLLILQPRNIQYINNIKTKVDTLFKPTILVQRKKYAKYYRPIHRVLKKVGTNFSYFTQQEGGVNLKKILVLKLKLGYVNMILK